MPNLVLVGREPNEPVPALTVYATDAMLRPIAAAPVDERGGFRLPDETLEKAAYIAIAPAEGGREPRREPLPRKGVVLYRPDQFRALLKTGGDSIELARARWTTLFPLFRRCVTGRVRRCHWWPWWWLAQDIAVAAQAADPILAAPRAAAPALAAAPVGAITAALRPGTTLRAELLRQPLRPILPPFRCAPVCEGLVEVHQRICCRLPIVIRDPRIDEIIRRLKELVLVERIPRFPPIPNPPDPPPFEGIRLFRGGALDEAALNAPQDLAALERLPPAEQAAYIEARPYLRHLIICGESHRVGQGFLQPDGSFQVCWRAFPIILRPNCHIEVAYVVKQVIGGTTVTIYDGLAANQWYDLDETPTLTSYHPQAVGCRDGEDPRIEGAVIYLDAIGNTDAWELKTPDAAGWNRVAAPGFNDGLFRPEPDPDLAKGQMKNCNWGGTLLLRWWFTEPCRAAGVRYYRASVVPADAFGNPQAGAVRTYLAPPNGGKWQKLTFGPGGLDVVSVPLGVAPVGGQSDLYTIPYDGDLNPATEEWRDGQFHAELNTAGLPEGRWLLTLEVFDAAGNKLRPQGTPAVPGEPASTERDFRFKRWHAPGTPDVFLDLPFAGLTHMLWWDNRAGTGDIRGLRRNGAETAGECQFLSGPGTTTLQVDFIAHHPVSMFQLSHGLTWYRGINGSSGGIPVAAPFENEGSPPATAASSSAVSFATLLGPHTACSFAVHLSMALKTWNGSAPLYPSSVREVAAFALTIA